jgi:hypothetical protein
MNALAAPLPILEPLDPARSSRANWISRGLSIVLLITVLVQMQTFDIGHLRDIIPTTWGFWLAFAALYFTLPVADFLIFRRLWGLGPSALPIMVRKRIANELVLSYSGEAWFYLWARDRPTLKTVAFGAIKDVNILSALAANLITLCALALAYPFVAELDHGRHANMALLSVAVILVISLAVLLFRRLLFTLSASELTWVGIVHIVRLIVTTALLGLCWHLALPSVPVGMWLMLAALRLVVSRLPIFPAKDVLFTSVSLFLLGGDSATASTVALVTALTLALHLVLALILGLTGLNHPKEKAATI